MQYRVRAGDSFWSIASEYCGSGFKWKEISDANPTVPCAIKTLGMVCDLTPGQVINVPCVVSAPAPEPRPSPMPQPAAAPPPSQPAAGDDYWARMSALLSTRPSAPSPEPPKPKEPGAMDAFASSFTSTFSNYADIVKGYYQRGRQEEKKIPWGWIGGITGGVLVLGGVLFFVFRKKS